MIYLILIFLFANDLFMLLPWELPVPPKDIGLIMIFLGLAQQILFKRANLAPFSNAFTWLFLGYLILVMTQVALAAINYDQTLMRGLQASRHQFYYLSFFLFLLVLRNPEEISKLLNALTIVALGCVILSVFEYVGFEPFHHKFADIERIRGGIVRADVPGMDLISLAYLWNVSRWSYPAGASASGWSKVLTIVFIGAHFFRQARFRLFSVMVASIWQLVVRGKVGVLAGMSIVGLCAVMIASYTMETNLFLEPFVTGVEDVTEQTGTAVGRLRQLETDIEVFKQYPYIGGGTAALAPDDPGFANLARKTDLGYSHWLKHYGILGIAWLLLFLTLLFIYTRKLQKVLPRDYSAIAAFSMSYLIFFTVSFVTLNHLMFRASTLVMCLYCAILVRLARSYSSPSSLKKSLTGDGLVRQGP